MDAGWTVIWLTKRQRERWEINKYATIWWCQFRQKAQSWRLLTWEQRALDRLPWSALLTTNAHHTLTYTHCQSDSLTHKHTQLCVSDFKLLSPAKGHKRWRTAVGLITSECRNERHHVVLLLLSLQHHWRDITQLLWLLSPPGLTN